MILVDRRTGSKEFAPLLRKQGVPVKVLELEAADFAFDGYGPGDQIITIGIERKTITDLIDSFKTGRLAKRQLPLMCDLYEHRYLLIEGVWRPNPYSGVLEYQSAGKWRRLAFGTNRKGFAYGVLARYLTSMCRQADLYTVKTGGKMHTVYEILALYNWYQELWSDHTTVKSGYVKSDPPRARTGQDGREVITYGKAPLVQRIAKEFASIGWELAGRAADVFTSVREMVNATKKDWQRIDGIGAKKAESIINEIEEERKR